MFEKILISLIELLWYNHTFKAWRRKCFRYKCSRRSIYWSPEWCWWNTKITVCSYNIQLYKIIFLFLIGRLEFVDIIMGDATVEICCNELDSFITAISPVIIKFVTLIFQIAADHGAIYFVDDNLNTFLRNGAWSFDLLQSSLHLSNNLIQ